MISLAINMAIFNPVHSQTTPRKSTIFFSPESATYLHNSNFDVSIFLDTKGNSINTIELDLRFPKDKLILIGPKSKSIIELWAEPPFYSNTEGIARFIGGIPGGITANSGLIITLTFQAIATGEAIIEIVPSSKILTSDGLAANILTGFGKAIYEINPKPPAGMEVFSETHPFEDQWYNNKNPILRWRKDDGVNGFSFIIDSKPLTIPDNISDTEDTIKAFEDLGDGIWFFHIKARKNGVWGPTSHFQIQIDSIPPNPFKPEIVLLNAKIENKILLRFSTTDDLSGINHYEVGLINKNTASSELPVFIYTDSPYQVPFGYSGNLFAVIRAFDNAGNVTDAEKDIYIPSPIISAIEENSLTIIAILTAFIFFAGAHFLFNHKIIDKFKIFKRNKEV